jgi:hypothetical protein
MARRQILACHSVQFVECGVVQRFTLTQRFWAQIGLTVGRKLRILFVGNEQRTHSLGWVPGRRRSRRKRNQAQKHT